MPARGSEWKRIGAHGAGIKAVTHMKTSNRESNISDLVNSERRYDPL